MNRKLLTNMGLIVLAVAVVIGFQMISGSTAKADNVGKDCVCHAAGKDSSPDTPQQYICLHPSKQGVTLNDNGGHLNEDTKNHAPDFLCSDCSECGPAPSPEPTPAPSPAPSPSPSPA